MGWLKIADVIAINEFCETRLVSLIEEAYGLFEQMNLEHIIFYLHEIDVICWAAVFYIERADIQERYVSEINEMTQRLEKTKQNAFRFYIARAHKNIEKKYYNAALKSLEKAKDIYGMFRKDYGDLHDFNASLEELNSAYKKAIKDGVCYYSGMARRKGIICREDFVFSNLSKLIKHAESSGLFSDYELKVFTSFLEELQLRNGINRF